MTLISIHSLRVEGDTFSNFLILIQLRFQSTPSVWRETMSSTLSDTKTIVFQSTPSVWRETVPFTTLASGAKNFNPLPPCGGRHPEQLDLEQEEKISIHSLRVEGDVPVVGILQFGLRFQSTPSVWRETSVLVFLRSYAGNFNPLPPCGGRPPRHDPPVITMPFQSTPSVWRETF